MKRVFLALLFFFITTGCDNEKEAVILLGKESIDPSSYVFEDRMPVFSQRERIYYILLTKEPIQDAKLRIQILRLEKKYPYHGIKMAYGADINRGKETRYLKDYFVLHKAGNYVIRIFGVSDFEKPIAETEFLVKKL